MNGKNAITWIKGRRRIIIRLVPSIVFCVGWLSGCMLSPEGLGDTGGTDYAPPITQILKVIVRPDTVAPGDSASFTCIVKDSTNSRLKFIWYMPVGTALTGRHVPYGYNPAYVTDINVLHWKAPEKPDVYYFEVTVDTTTHGFSFAQETFTITVK